MNFIKICFAQMALVMVILGGLINTIEKYLPNHIVRTFRYGKFAYQESSKCFVNYLEVPKSWFRHFYIFSSLATTIALILLINTYILNNPVPKWTIEVLNSIAGIDRHSSVSLHATILALILLTIQCYRRLYDTHFVSIFGEKSKMNLTHYMVGFIHYAGALLAILAEAPKFSTTNLGNSNDVSYWKIFATGVFLWAWWHQYVATKILANLRTNGKGKIVSQSHHVPNGDLFEFVSSPHLLCEILMYATLTIILWGNSTWLYVFFWVLTNQVETALLSHWWYQKKFPKYPTNRKILIPFIF